MKVRKALWFGFALMAVIITGAAYVMASAETITHGHYGLLMLALVVVAIMLGFPTAFTLMGMGVIFTWLAYDRDTGRTLDLMVQSAYKVMSNDVLISIPLFVFMGYLVERANLIDKLFKSLHLSLARVPGSLAVATLFTCTIFATATGIVGAVVTLMGLLAFPQMLKAGYDVRLGAGAITAGGCLGILIPPSVMLIVYGATAGVSVVQLYAGAFFPGLMLAGLYVVYVVILAKLKPSWAPPLSAEQRHVELPPLARRIADTWSRRALPGLLKAFKGRRNESMSTPKLLGQLFVALLPLFFFGVVMFEAYLVLTRPAESVELPPGVERIDDVQADSYASGLSEPPVDGGLQEPAAPGGLQEPPATDAPGEASGAAPAPAAAGAPAASAEPAAETPTAEADGTAAGQRLPAPVGYWIACAAGVGLLVLFYAFLTFQRLEIFKMLLASFFPLVVLILAVLGSIVFGLATPTEAAAVGAFGGYVLAAIYLLLNYPRPYVRRVLMIWIPLWIPLFVAVSWLRFPDFFGGPIPNWIGLLAIGCIALWALLALRQAGLFETVRESTFLTAKTSAMVCWLFVGSSIFSAAFALLGGQDLVERWVLSLGLSKTQFLLLSQCVIFLLGWPLEWTEIIVIFMPIFIPLLDNFGIDPLFFGLLVALNLQTAFLSPPVAMSAFYLKGVAPPHVTLNQIFAGMMPFMGIQILAIFLLYLWPQIGLWLPSVLYGR